MRKLWSTLALLTLAATLAGCGGDSTAFVPSSSAPSGTSTVGKLTVAPSVTTLPPDGTTATITATATDSNNVAVDGAAVTFATSAGTLAVTSGTTSATGQATATLSAQGIAAGTVITVTATSGSVSGKTTVTVANTQQTLTLSTSAPQIPSASGGTPATIKALLVNANNNVVPGAAVTFTASSGALTVTQATTDSTGKAIATLSAGPSAQNRTVTVTATSGTSSATIQIPVVGTTLTLSGPTSLVQGGVPGSYTATLTDSGGTGIVSQTIMLSSALGNTLTPASVTTGSLGTATFTLTASKAGTDTITATTADVPAGATEQLTISSQNVSITTPVANTNININTPTPVDVTWTNGGVNVTSGTVNFATSRGTLAATAVPVANGAASTTVSSTTAGPALITATAVAGSSTTSTQVQVNFVAPVSTAQSVSVQGNPSNVPLQGQSTIVATVTDGPNATGNPIEGAVVNFGLTDSTGGTLSTGSAVTNAQGQATVTYTASTVSSAPNGVVITASLASPALTGTTTLTVGGQTVFLSLGTGNTLTVPNSTQFEMPFTVQAVDAAGNGLNGVTVTFSVQSVAYAMGAWEPGSPWTQVLTAGGKLSPLTCPAVYVNETNGVITGAAGTGGTLIPGSVASTDVTSAVTANNGTASLNVIYPQDHSLWVAVALTATATVQGTQNSTTSTFWLPILTTDIASPSVTPPSPIGQYNGASAPVSPYGTATTCW